MDMLPSSSPRDQSGSSILDQLEFLQQVTGNSTQQAVAVVQPAGYESLDHHLSSVFCDGSDDRAQTYLKSYIYVCIAEYN